MTEERRAHPRKKTPAISVRYERIDGVDRIRGTLLDASLGGLFIEATEMFEEGNLVTLELQGIGGAIACEGRVIWLRPKAEGDERPAGMGLRIIHLSDEDTELLGKLLDAKPAETEKTVLGVGLEAKPA